VRSAPTSPSVACLAAGSQVAAKDQLAHDVLVALSPAFQATLDAELQQDLAAIRREGQNGRERMLCSDSASKLDRKNAGVSLSDGRRPLINIANVKTSGYSRH
jgi:hypothetical protein